LGGTSIKAVELKNVGNRPQLVTYGFVDGGYNIVNDDSKEAQSAIASHLKELIKRSRISTDKAIAAMPSFSVFSSIISLPAMSKKDLISAVRWEAKKFVPIPLEEMILDWEVIGTTEGDKKAVLPQRDKEDDAEKKEDDKKESVQGAHLPDGQGSASGGKDKEGSKNDTSTGSGRGKKEKDKSGEAGSGSAGKDKKNKTTSVPKGNVRVLLTAAPKELVNRYVELFREVGLQLIGLETESFALERSLIGHDKNPIMVVDIGSQSTSIIIFAGSVPILNRSIDVGGKTITKSLVESMGISEAQAEQFKLDMNMSVSEDVIEKLPQPIRYMINSIVNEIRYILNIYQGQNKEAISKVVLTGGSAFLSNLTNYIQTIFNTKAYIGDPWARVVHPVEIDVMLKQLGPRLSVSIGLAMREIS